MDEIGKLRKEIDTLDTKIMSLLDKRYHLTTKIGDIKHHQNTAIFDTDREQIIINKISKYSHSPQIEVVYKTIMEESKKLQRK